MSTTDELSALKTVIDTLEGLEDEAARERILDYAFKKLGKAMTGKIAPPLTPKAEAIIEAVHQRQPELFEVFADLYDGARPKTDADKALVAGYWVQVCGGAADFGSQTLNSELKQLGYPVGNITRALDALKPSLVQQMRKDGNSKQARKTFRLTSEGKKRVESMVARAKDPDGSPTP